MSTYETGLAIRKLDEAVQTFKEDVTELQNLQSYGMPMVSKLKLFAAKRLAEKFGELELLAADLYLHANVAQAHWIGDKVNAITELTDTLRTIQSEEQNQLQQGEENQ